MQLLDQYGRAVKRKVLAKPVAEPGLTGVRQAWAPTIASGLTPQRLASVLASANEGNIADYLVLAEEMEERDPHYASVLGVRKRAVSGVVPQVIAVSDATDDQTLADDVRNNLVEHDGFTDLIEDMLDALGKGFSAVEIMWHGQKRNWTIDKFVHRDPRFFKFDDVSGRELRLLDEADMIDGLPLAPAKWIQHVPKLKSGLPIRGGLARLVAFGWICKSYTMKDWMAFVETYGLPLRLGRYGPQANAEDVEKLYQAVANIGTDAAAILPEAMRIDFEQIAAGPGNDIFEKLARWVDEQTSKAVLGQTMTSDDGSSMAQAEVHNDVRHDIAKSDARSVTGTLNRDLVRPYINFNYGPQDAYPRIVIAVEEAEDTDKVLQNTNRIVARGLRVKASEVRSKLGYSEPDDDDEVIGGAKPKPATAEARNRAEPPARPDPYAETDAVQQDALEDWDPIMRAMLAPIIELLQTAESYDEAQKMIAEAYPEMAASTAIDSLVKAAVKARADGDAPDA